MDLKDFYYDLPQELIAQHPAEKRDMSRLMFLDKYSGEIRHGTFRDILGMFEPGDCLILNDSRVIPARLFAKRVSDGAEIEVFLLRPLDNSNTWECLVKPGKKMKTGTKINVRGIDAEVTDVFESGNRAVHFEFDGDFKDKLNEIGQIPLPPYIHEEQEDYGRYQTVYAKYDGSVAAPTAGLHFTEELLGELKNKGVEIGFVTLHVGLGTFRPVKEEKIEDHKMHSEFFILPEETAEIINKAKKDGHRVTAVGTTCTRTLETAGSRLGITKDNVKLTEMAGETDIFIYPPYEFKVIDRLITNFHLPESTLIMLVSALAGRENVLNAYKEAVKEKYRFFSFGDAMFIG
ncbi:MAG: tRNA preQ1(34) S-adenosylmethionine ribosyltransferase-isomerase QueA [Clostridia bacterium]|nr:tRNA preQ1(34) S-adenosylmethionine ribosyltransferase-isomerase QueA [Clostridia bacterium]